MIYLRPRMKNYRENRKSTRLHRNSKKFIHDIFGKENDDRKTKKKKIVKLNSNNSLHAFIHFHNLKISNQYQQWRSLTRRVAKNTILRVPMRQHTECTESMPDGERLSSNQRGIRHYCGNDAMDKRRRCWMGNNNLLMIS